MNNWTLNKINKNKVSKFSLNFFLNGHEKFQIYFKSLKC